MGHMAMPMYKVWCNLNGSRLTARMAYRGLEECMGDLVKLKRAARHRADAQTSSPTPSVEGRFTRSRLMPDALGGLPKVVILKAPAGFGKTTLMSQWCEVLTESGENTAWLTLNEDDCESDMFNLRLEQACAALVDEAAAITGSSRRYLFLDAYEHISGEGSEKLIRRLHERNGDDLCVIIGTRLDTHIGVSRLRLEEQVIEIDREDLRFTQSEMTDAFNAWDAVLKPNQFAGLAKITEGWPAAMQFARQALEKKTSTASGLANGDLVAWANLRAYVYDEIVTDLPDQAKQFLFETAPLGRFTLSLASVVTENSAAAALMADIEGNGLLLRLSSEERNWRCYHPLLAACIEDQLRIDTPDRLLEIHRKAMGWHMEQGRLSDAIRHAFAADDQATAAELLAQASLERRRLGQVNANAAWPGKLSNENFDLHPILRIRAACSLASRIDVEAARTQADTVRNHFNELDPIVRDDLYAVDAMIAVYGDQPLDAIETSERGLRSCSVCDPYTMGTLRLCGAIGRIAKGDIDQARRLIATARADNEQADSVFGLAVSHALQGLVRAISGDLVDAVHDWRRAETVIQPVAVTDAVEAIAIGYLPEALYEWNDFEGAQHYIDKCLASSLEVALPDMIISVFLTAIRIAYARGDRKTLRQTLEYAERTGHLRGWSRLVHAIGWERVRMALHDKKLDKAQEFRGRINSSKAFHEKPGVMTHALETEADLIGELRFEMATSPGPSVLARLRGARTQALGHKRKWRAAKLLVLEAVARDGMGDDKAAQRCMRQALELGEKGKLIRTIIDEGPIAAGLVRSIASIEKSGPNSIGGDYLASLLQAVGDAPVAPAEPAFAVEALSDREFGVLKMLAAGLSNREAGERLFISENTVKWHLQHVYSKLGVRNRTGALAVARRLDLLR
jgi:LuxR family transcriptional regulator, maltose regulon positive regulatory protein